MEKKWYALYTKSKCEKKVAELLSKKGVINYCPLNKKIRQWSDRKKIILEPLFPSYVFVFVEEPQIVMLKKLSDNIVNPVFWLGKPALIKGEEIQAIRDFIEEYNSVRLIKQKVNMNDKVKIINGPFNNIEASVNGFKNSMISLVLPSLGYMILSEISLSDVEIIADFSIDHEGKFNRSFAI